MSERRNFKLAYNMRFTHPRVYIGVLLVISISVLYVLRGRIFSFFYAPTRSKLEQGVGGAEPNARKEVEVIADNLQIPWAVAFLPDGDLLVTERPGTLRRIGANKHVYKIEGVHHVGEGGLLGMALHPNFKENHFIYLYLTTAGASDVNNRVERYRLENDMLLDRKIILEGIPGAVYHDGGRIAFGPDRFLYITTGDSGKSDLAQDTHSLAGKILRVGDDGSIPKDNPFGNAVWSYGHRNVQGIAWDDKGRLWATEHGRSGVLSGLDELNLIEKGKNYGWPVIQGDEARVGMETPVAQSGSDETWAPAGALFWDGSIFFGGLRGEAIYEAHIIGDRKVSLTINFHNQFGRIRDAVLGPDHAFYITTSNTDGRGTPKAGDDKIIRIENSVFRGK